MFNPNQDLPGSQVLISAYELSKQLDADVWKIPSTGQRGKTWTEKTYVQWPDSFIKSVSAPRTLDTIKVALVSDKIMDYQPMSKIYSPGKKGFLPGEYTDITSQRMVIDGYQRISSIYSWFNDGYMKESGERSSLAFNIIEKVSWISSHCHFSMLSYSDLIIRRNKHINFKHLLVEIALYVEGKKSLNSVVIGIQSLYQQKYGDDPIRDDIIESNILLVLNSGIFRNFLRIDLIPMPGDHMKLYFDQLNQKTGQSITMSDMTWINIGRLIRNSSKQDEIESFMRQHDLNTKFFAKFWVNINQDAYIKEAGERHIQNAKEFGDVDIDQFFEFLQMLSVELPSHGFSLNQLWKGHYWATNVFVGLWINQDILGSFLEDGRDVISQHIRRVYSPSPNGPLGANNVKMLLQNGSNPYNNIDFLRSPAGNGSFKLRTL